MDIDSPNQRKAIVPYSQSNVIKALVLSGGGARGAFEAGAIQSLRRFGPYDVICGTSTGAINGALAAQDAYQQLDEVWHNIGFRSVIQYVGVVRRVIEGISCYKAIRTAPFFRKIADAWRVICDFIYVILRPRLLLRLLGAIDPNPITKVLTQYLSYKALQHTLIVTATNITRQSADTFYFAPDGGIKPTFAAKRKAGTARYQLSSSNYVDAVQASTSIPGAFPPVKVAADSASFQYVDGGVANNTPIGMAVDAGATEITVVFVDPADSEPAEQTVTNMAQLGLACLTVMQKKILEDDLKLAQTYNAAIAAGAGASAALVAGKIPLDLYVVRPSAALPLSVLDFDKQELIDEAYAAGLAAGLNRQSL